MTQLHGPQRHRRHGLTNSRNWSPAPLQADDRAAKLRSDHTIQTCVKAMPDLAGAGHPFIPDIIHSECSGHSGIGQTATKIKKQRKVQT